MRCDLPHSLLASLFCSLHFVCPPSPMIVVCAVSHSECDGRWDIMDGTCWALMSWPKIAATSEHYGNWFFTVVVVAVYLSTSPPLRFASRFHFFGGEKQINHSRSVCQCKYLCMLERESDNIAVKIHYNPPHASPLHSSSFTKTGSNNGVVLILIMEIHRADNAQHSSERRRHSNNNWLWRGHMRR